MHSLLLIGLLIAGNDTMKDLAVMQGDWKIEWIEFDGKKFESTPEDERITTVRGDKCYRKDRFLFSIKVYPQYSPKLIDVTFPPDEGETVGQTFEGLYRIEGNTLVWCYRRDDIQNRPSTFEAAKGSGVLAVGHSRVKR